MSVCIESWRTPGKPFPSIFAWSTRTQKAHLSGLMKNLFITKASIIYAYFYKVKFVLSIIQVSGTFFFLITDLQSPHKMFLLSNHNITLSNESPVQHLLQKAIGRAAGIADAQ